LIRLSGLEPYKDVQIVFTGLRPGEKLNEELVGGGEETIPTSAEKIRLVERNGGSAANVAVALQHLIDSLSAGRTADLMRALGARGIDDRPLASQRGQRPFKRLASRRDAPRQVQRNRAADPRATRNQRAPAAVPAGVEEGAPDAELVHSRRVVVAHRQPQDGLRRTEPGRRRRFTEQRDDAADAGPLQLAPAARKRGATHPQPMFHLGRQPQRRLVAPAGPIDPPATAR